MAYVVRGAVGDKAADLLSPSAEIRNNSSDRSRLTMSCTPVIQYQRLVKTDCSSLVYHIEVLLDCQRDSSSSSSNRFTHRMMKAGWTQDSNIPSRNRTAIRLPKVFAAAEHATIAPQRKTLRLRLINLYLFGRGTPYFTARYLATGSF